jgi:hypothetical protein
MTDLTPIGSRPPGLRLHKRTRHVQSAEAHFQSNVFEFQQQSDLTDIEMLQILIECQRSITKYMLRAERHPDDPERKADEE